MVIKNTAMGKQLWFFFAKLSNSESMTPVSTFIKILIFMIKYSIFYSHSISS